MELRHLRYFIAVAQEMNMHRAAKRLNISQPPLSLTIKQLEEEIGTQLFDRVGRAIKITRAGEDFLCYAQEAIQQSEIAKQHARLIGEGKKGVLKIGFISSAVSGMLQEIVLNARQETPDIQLKLSQSVSGRLGEKVINKTYDIGLIRHPEYLPEGIISRELTREHWCVIFRKEHCFSQLKSVSIEQLAHEDIIFYPRYNNPAAYDDLMQIFSEKGVKPNIIQEALEQMTIAGLVSSGLGVGIVPACMQSIHVSGIKYLPIEGTENQTGFSIIYRDEGDPLIETFLGCLRTKNKIYGLL